MKHNEFDYSNHFDQFLYMVSTFYGQQYTFFSFPNCKCLFLNRLISCFDTVHDTEFGNNAVNEKRLNNNRRDINF